MSYVFDGILVFSDNASALSAAQDAAPDALGPRLNVFSEPFPGFAVAFAADHDLQAYAALEELYGGGEPTPDASPALAFSTAHPKVNVVHVRVDCWGGRCTQAGFAAQAGAVRAHETAREDLGVDSPLTRLCAALGAVMPSGWHRALERSFFPPAPSPASDP